MRATRVRVAAIARGQNARARVDVRRIAETATARVGAGGRARARDAGSTSLDARAERCIVISTSITINFLENITDEGDQQDTPRRDADISAAS